MQNKRLPPHWHFLGHDASATALERWQRMKDEKRNQETVLDVLDVGLRRSSLFSHSNSDI